MDRFSFLSQYIELADHLKQLVSQNLHLQAWRANLKALEILPICYREVRSTTSYTQSK